jgi:hypothetical protein
MTLDNFSTETAKFLPVTSLSCQRAENLSLDFSDTEAKIPGIDRSLTKIF